MRSYTICRYILSIPILYIYTLTHTHTHITNQLKDKITGFLYVWKTEGRQNIHEGYRTKKYFEL